VDEPTQSLAGRFDEGAALFNSGDYFACHEAWEDVWRELHGERRLFVQGLIQIAVALYHATRWNTAGARGLFSRGVARLERFAPEYCGVNVGALLADIAPCRAAAELREPLPNGGLVLHYDPERTARELFGEPSSKG
jgi:predicted metal-dependent hydrolase